MSHPAELAVTLMSHPSELAVTLMSHPAVIIVLRSCHTPGGRAPARESGRSTGRRGRSLVGAGGYAYVTPGGARLWLCHTRRSTVTVMSHPAER
eukprot:4386390-Pyramimonas_sp.AAC.2